MEVDSAEPTACLSDHVMAVLLLSECLCWRVELARCRGINELDLSTHDPK